MTGSAHNSSEGPHPPTGDRGEGGPSERYTDIFSIIGAPEGVVSPARAKAVRVGGLAGGGAFVRERVLLIGTARAIFEWPARPCPPVLHCSSLLPASLHPQAASGNTSFLIADQGRGVVSEELTSAASRIARAEAKHDGGDQ